VADTPLHKVAGVVNLDEVKASLFKMKLVEPSLDQYQQQPHNAPAVTKTTSPPLSPSKSVDTHDTEGMSNPHSVASSSSSFSSSGNKNNEDDGEKGWSSNSNGDESDPGQEEAPQDVVMEQHVVQQMQEESTTVSSMLANTTKQPPVSSRQSSTGSSSQKSNRSGHCATTVTVTNVASPHNPKKNSMPMSIIECDTSIKIAPPEFFDIENSFASIVQTSYKLTKMYADQYDTQLIKYVEQWITTVSARVDSWMGEFADHTEKLTHYREKIEKLNHQVEMADTKQKTLPQRKLEKWERNKLKLNGAREAHDSYGESLYLLLEEIVERAWRDVFPVLLRTLEFQMNHSQDDAKVCTKLTTSIQELYRIGYEEGVSPQGRLEQLKTQKPEILYTGLRDHVLPVVPSKASSLTPPPKQQQQQQAYSSSSATAISF